MAPRYSKEMPGAEQVLCSGDVSGYADESWDLRISVGDAPLAEAFFFSVESLADANRSVRELLEQFALNPEREAELNVDEYPDLPFLQQELIQYFEAAKRGQFKLQVFVNHAEGKLDLDSAAITSLARCTFRNKTWDYLVLDLIFEAVNAPVDAQALSSFIARHPTLGKPDALREEAANLVTQYEKFASVSVAPCALGVPDGFDVRLQMMEFDGLDPEQCVLVGLLAEGALEWADAFESVCEALAFKTNFTSEILNELKGIENT
ncbi:MAG: hypothetical protein V5783_01680 [Pontiella sp.]